MTEPRWLRFEQCAYFGVVASFGLTACPTPTLAQNITLDGTLGPTANLTGPVYNIPQTVGSTSRSNLFHSFAKFNLDTGEVANFQSAGDIRNIFARVTGGSASSIDGLIRTEQGNVNLFLINPSGILFGANAQLDIGNAIRGSFVATTVDGLSWPNGAQFSATSPGNAQSLLTIVGDPSGFFASQRTIAPISATGSTLSVFAGQSLVLLGGNINLANSTLFSILRNNQTEGGRVELGGIAGAGVVSLNLEGNKLRLKFPQSVDRANVSLNRTELNVVAGDKGDIAIYARDINSVRSTIAAGIQSTFGTSASRVGDITLDATGNIRIAGSLLINFVDSDTIGQGGNIQLTALGDITIDRSRGTTFLNERSQGSSGDFIINANSLFLTNGAVLAAVTQGQGNAGKIVMQLEDAVLLAQDSTIFNLIDSGGVGAAGGVTIQARSLTLKEGAQIQLSNFGQGEAGDVTLQIRDRTSIEGFGPQKLASGIFNQVEPDAIGDGGNILVNTGSLQLTNGGLLTTTTRGQGKAGTVSVNAKGDILIDGFGFFDVSQIATTVGTGGMDDGGNIEITAQSLFITNGGDINASTFGQGKGGNINVQVADQVILDGVKIADQLVRENGQIVRVNRNKPFRSGLGSVVGFDGIVEGLKDGGDVSITARSVQIRNGASLSTSTGAQGNAGNIIIQASESVILNGQGIDGSASTITSEATPRAIGNGGRIRITTDVLSLTDAAQVSSSSAGKGSAGNIETNARLIRFNNKSSMTTETALGNGGDIKLQAKDVLLLRNASFISANAGTAETGGDGGNIAIAIPKGFIVGIPLENSDIKANAFTGKGGRVEIISQGIFGIQARPRLTPLSDITASSEAGPTGTITIAPPDVDPNRGLVPLPITLSDPSNKIDQQCATGSRVSSSQFVVTGRSGLPVNPENRINSEATIVRLATLPATTIAPQKAVTHQPNSSTIVEAQTAIRQSNGLIHLIATKPQSNLGLPVPRCKRND